MPEIKVPVKAYTKKQLRYFYGDNGIPISEKLMHSWLQEITEFKPYRIKKIGNKQIKVFIRRFSWKQVEIIFKEIGHPTIKE